MARTMEHRNFRHENFQPYAVAIGQMTLAWNDLHMSLAALFWGLLRIPNGMVPYAVWNSIKSDRAQREMIQAAIDTQALGHEIPAKARSEISWILKKATSLEDFRNDALHSPFVVGPRGDVIPFYGLGNKRAQKLRDKDLLKEFDLFYETIIMLRDYASDLHDAMRSANVPWPDRPQLPNRGSRKKE